MAATSVRQLSIVGEALDKQGNLPEALRAFENALAIQDRLANADPGNADVRTNLATYYQRAGDVLKAQGNTPQAMKSFQESLAIRERLVKANPNNAVWQSSLGVSYERVGDVFFSDNNVPEARNFYEKSLAISKRLVQASSSDAAFQHDLAVAHFKLATVFALQGEPASARDALEKAREIMARTVALSPDNAEWKRNLAAYRDTLAIFPRWQVSLEVEAAFKVRDYAKAAAAQEKLTAMVENAPPVQGGKPGQATADAYLELSWYRLFARDFAGALFASERATALSTGPSYAMNKAHALMFLGRKRQARALYLRYKRQPVDKGGALWEAVVLDDFRQFEEQGLKHPQMAEIKALLAAK